MTNWFNLQGNPILSTLQIVLLILCFATLLFWIWKRIKPSNLVSEMQTRTHSWWLLSAFVGAVVLSPAIIGTILLGLLALTAFRELSSISKNIRSADRNVIIWCYIAIPIQFVLAYFQWFHGFIVFIPVFMFIWIPMMLVLKGESDDIGKSMSVLPSELMLTVFSISNLAFLLNLPSSTLIPAGGAGMVLFIVFLTEMNDVFQFTWGKLLGKNKITPSISPNKTWEGFIGGVISTSLLGYSLRFLTPFDHAMAWIVPAVLAVSGFIGDVMLSAIKRDVGIKDTGHLIPGHGGILDRVDSLLLTSVVFFHIHYALYHA
jgi:phosphatidate cytidylyltransferase